MLSAFRHVEAGVRTVALCGRSQCTFWRSVLSDRKQYVSILGKGPVSMHLLMLSAFRQFFFVVGVMSVIVSMHLLALSAFRLADEWASVEAPSRSQCTFWCSVLSDQDDRVRVLRAKVSMHLLVLSAFRPTARHARLEKDGVSMHLLVLSAFRPGASLCSPTSTRVSMHLLVLSAFRRKTGVPHISWEQRLNAPSGAQCFPTRDGVAVEQTWDGRLNAPSGAQCFPTPPPENRATTPFTGTKSPPTWKAPHRIGSHLSN